MRYNHWFFRILKGQGYQNNFRGRTEAKGRRQNLLFKTWTKCRNVLGKVELAPQLDWGPLWVTWAWTKSSSHPSGSQALWNWRRAKIQAEHHNSEKDIAQVLGFFHSVQQVRLHRQGLKLLSYPFLRTFHIFSRRGLTAAVCGKPGLFPVLENFQEFSGVLDGSMDFSPWRT